MDVPGDPAEFDIGEGPKYRTGDAIDTTGRFSVGGLAILRRRGQPTKARPHLAQALAIAEKCEATWLADQARAELVIAGGSHRRRHED